MAREEARILCGVLAGGTVGEFCANWGVVGSGVFGDGEEDSRLFDNAKLIALGCLINQNNEPELDKS